ncbi:hypothetical protein HELRODRAFT_115456 [Helobdella robusta]|uniref:Rho-GAP domain-containing protein n=1 Tax=Helobdella robusta TaxID=6412 RepID=T1EG83_HELRO|nr:hypothetical protein HELRODRAFT_115456 [Helobdella robusta]ESN93582.1 hypothetical protein HELRODRAFT_115456 [Helobdella robusta]
MMNPNFSSKSQYHQPQAQTTTSQNVIANKVAGTLLQQMHIEQFVLENLNEHRKWLLGKAVSVGHMLSWTKDPITKPMIRTNNKSVKKEASEVFKLIQVYMGDRKSKEPLAQIALEIAVRGWISVEMRDEIYIQLCRQTTKNPREDSAVQGWELLGICLAFFPPSCKFYSYLEGHICKNVEAYNQIDKAQSLTYIYTLCCQKRLQWVVNCGAKKGLKKPSLEEIDHAKKSMVEQSMFGCTLSEVMNLQKERYPESSLPWIQTMLSEEVLRLNGAATEGIFRIPGDIDEVNSLKVRCDRWLPPPSNLHDPHVPASLLKLWYRELQEPLIPYAFHQQCIDSFADPDASMAVISSLPEINRSVITYLIRFLQVFCRPENVQCTKMDVNNLAMVMAPNCLRCLSSDPRVIFDNTRKEMAFIRNLLLHLDTSSFADFI